MLDYFLLACLRVCGARLIFPPLRAKPSAVWWWCACVCVCVCVCLCGVGVCCVVWACLPRRAFVCEKFLLAKCVAFVFEDSGLRGPRRLPLLFLFLLLFSSRFCSCSCSSSSASAPVPVRLPLLFLLLSPPLLSLFLLLLWNSRRACLWIWC